ncbi:MAG: helix-turn-helix transcriptional regulator [Nakamurella sp.]
MDRYPEAIAAALRGEAAARKVSYRDLADRTGIPLRTLSRYMTGERAITVENFMQIADALEASATDLISDVVRRAGTPTPI